MALAPSLSEEHETAFNLTRKDHKASWEYLNEHTALKQIIELVRHRFKSIDALLKEVGINKHDLSHQLRTASYAVAAMRKLGFFSHREIVATGVASAIHDFGYLHRDPGDADEEGYNSGVKGTFKKHALHGAEEVKQIINGLLDFIQDEAFINSSPEIRAKAKAYRKLLTYKDENGQEKLVNEEDIDAIWEAIVHHNDYGKDMEGYDPRRISKGALMTQLFDKLDICRQRVYKKDHMIPSDFAPGDQRSHDYFHRSVPYCITDYQFKIDQAAGEMTVIYEVDLDRLNRVMQNEYPNFCYTPDAFVEDFNKAYRKNLRVAAEAIGVILDHITDRPTLIAELKFKQGGSVALPFIRKNRKLDHNQKGPSDSDSTAEKRAMRMNLISQREQASV